MTPDVVIDWMFVALMAALFIGPTVAAIILGIGGCVEWFDKRRAAQQTMQNRT